MGMQSMDICRISTVVQVSDHPPFSFIFLLFSVLARYNFRVILVLVRGPFHSSAPTAPLPFKFSFSFRFS